MGFPAIYSSSCDNVTDIRVINFDADMDLDHYLNPIALIICYLTIAITSVLLLDPQVNFYEGQTFLKYFTEFVARCASEYLTFNI